MGYRLKAQKKLHQSLRTLVPTLLALFLCFSYAEAGTQVTGARVWAGDGKQQFISP